MQASISIINKYCTFQFPEESVNKKVWELYCFILRLRLYIILH